MIVLDIETVPLDSRISDIDERYLPKVDARLTDPAKIEKARAELEADVVKAKSLDPDFGRVVSIGILDRNHDNEEIFLYGEDERDILERYWRFIKKRNPAYNTIGYNTFKFDLPFLFRRSLYHRIAMPVQTVLKRFTRIPHFDILQELCNWDTFGNKIKSLDFYAQAFRLDHQKFGEGSDILKWFQAGDWESIKKHNMPDVRIANQFYELLKDYIPGRDINRFDRSKDNY